jgi:MYXO-CTERM domain-containing protein
LALALVCTLDASAHAFQVKKNSKGHALRWAPEAIDVSIAMDAVPSGVDPGQAELAVRAAFQVWGDAIPTALSFDYSTMPSQSAKPNSRDHKNIIRWVAEAWDDDYDPDALAVTLTSYDPSSGQITDADIVVNAEHYQWSAGAELPSSCRGLFDLQSVLAHEVGHLLGMAHDKEHREATMFPSSAACELKKRDLDDDDVAGVEHLYLELDPVFSEDPQASALGCSVQATPRHSSGTSQASLLGLLTLAALVRLARRVRRSRKASTITGLVALALAVLPTGMAHATSARRLPLTSLAQASTLALRGQVAEQRVVKRDDRVYTESVVRVGECWKGTCGASILIRQLGGEIDGQGLSIEGSAALAVGDEVVLFLRVRKDGAFSPVGMAQGVFQITRDPKGQIVRLERDLRGLTFPREDGAEAVGAKEAFTFSAVRAAVTRK